VSGGDFWITDGPRGQVTQWEPPWADLPPRGPGDSTCCAGCPGYTKGCCRSHPGAVAARLQRNYPEAFVPKKRGLWSRILNRRNHE